MVLPGAPFQAAPKWEMPAPKMETFIMGSVNYWGDGAVICCFHTTARRQGLFTDVWMASFFLFFFFFVWTLYTVTLGVLGVSQTLMGIEITVCPSKMQTPGPIAGDGGMLFISVFFSFY